MLASAPDSAGVVVVAPAGARWAARAERMLVAASLHVARLYDLRAIGALLVRGGIEALVVDDQSLSPRWALLSKRIRSVAPEICIVVVCEDGTQGSEAVAWPSDPTEALRLVMATA